MGDRNASSVRDDVLWLHDKTFAAWNWAHKSVRDSLKGLSVAEAVWRPGRHTHSVWEQINHIAYWKEYIVKRVQSRHTRTPQAWPAGGRTAADLRRSIKRLARLHAQLHSAVRQLDPERFAGTGSGRYSLARLLLGAAAHDSYHVGQILLTRKLYRQTGRQRP